MYNILLLNFCQKVQKVLKLIAPAVKFVLGTSLAHTMHTWWAASLMSSQLKSNHWLDLKWPDFDFKTFGIGYNG